MENPTDKDIILVRAGGARNLAEMLDDITTQAIYAWREVPKGRMYELMRKRPEWFDPAGNLLPVDE